MREPTNAKLPERTLARQPSTGVHVARIAATCRLIERAQTSPSLNQLAAAAGLSPYHFHRVFKSITGMTPREYAVAHRAKTVRQHLRRNGTVTNAVFAAGFGSGSRFYEKSNGMLGMTPTQFRRGGMNTTIRFAIAESALGSILVAQSDKGICAILLGDDPDELARDLQDRFPSANLVGGDRGFEKLVARVIAFVEAPRIGLDLPLDIRGTAFQQRVWRALQRIPVGSTVSYADIAKRIGSPNSVRAVAGACAANAIAVAIPCHRVVRNTGALSGYRWGVDRKRALLASEADE